MYWKQGSEIHSTVPKTLDYKLGLYESNGLTAIYDKEPLEESRDDEIVNSVTDTELDEVLTKMPTSIDEIALKMPTKLDYINFHCRAHPSVNTLTKRQTKRRTS